MQEIKNIPVDEISDPQNPMRSNAQDNSIFALSQDIKERGLINPITVRPVWEHTGAACPAPVGGTNETRQCPHAHFEVVAGHRRFLACKLADMKEISCVVRDLSDDDVFAFMAAENLERVDVDPVDEALFLARYLREDEEKIPVVAKKLHRSVAWVESRLGILTYPDYMLVALKEGTLKLGVAEWLGRIENDVWRRQCVDVAVKQGMSVLTARYYHDQWKMGVSGAEYINAPPSDQGPDYVPPKARAICAACNQVAEEPNLQLLHCHVNCPEPGK